jgi:hypothetical protein
MVLNRQISRRCLWLGLTVMLVVGVLPAGALRPSSALGATPLLPDLVADPPDEIGLATDSSTGTTRLLLRFNGYIHNKGSGALDVRGSRVAPKLGEPVEKEVKEAEAKKEELPQQIEAELAASPMKASQRLFTTKEGEEETNIERPHVDEPSGGELLFSSADGHHHWHLQHAAKYSLWNSAQTAEVAPAQKVGFCLDDSQHVEPAKGPATPVYADSVPPFRHFCQQYHPNATSLFEGISPGWRDLYSRELAFQWVDASNVPPGAYWLREEVNPLGVIKETGGANVPVYAASPTIIPGFDALAQSTSTQAGEARTVTFTSKAWKDSATPKYSIVSQPQHGTLGAVSANHVLYTPNAGYTGPDSFAFSAADPSSQFPTSPAIATVSIQVTGGKILLAGDGTSAYGVPDQAQVGHEEAFQFTAQSTGTVEELEFRTDVTANTGVTGVVVGIFADHAGQPGEVLGAGTASGEPATNSWISATGLSTAVASGTKYWLVVLPLGEANKELHFDAAVAANGTGNVESIEGGLTEAMAESSWKPFDQGPVGFEALGAPPQPSVSISGAQDQMTAGTGATLTATVSNDTGGVEWSATGGTLAPEGPEGLKSLYTAPSAGGTVTITARLRDDRSVSAQQVITIVPAPAPMAAPEVATGGTSGSAGSGTSGSAGSGTSGSAGSGTSGSAGFKVSNPPPGVSRPRAMLFGRKLVMTTIATVGGRVRLSAYIHGHRIGTCVAATPAERAFTCRLTLDSKISLRARISVLASLRVGSLIFRSSLAAERIPQMKMKPAGLGAHASSVGGQFWCSPSTLLPTLSSGA